VLLLAGIEQNQRGESGRDEDVGELVAHGRDCARAVARGKGLKAYGRGGGWLVKSGW
jgi:hypothetical protein